MFVFDERPIRMSFCSSRSLVTERVDTHPFKGRKKPNPQRSLVPNGLLIRGRRESQCREVTKLMLPTGH